MSFTLGIRCSVTPEMAKSDITFFKDEYTIHHNLFDLWLKLTGMEVLEKVFGIHLTSGRRKHYHLHYILGNEFPFRQRPLQKFKYDLEHGKKGDALNEYLDSLKVTYNRGPLKGMPDCPYSFSEFWKSCLSMQVKKIPFMEENDLTYNNKRFISYPLKERLGIVELCATTYDLKEIEDLAAAEYEATVVKREKALAATMKTQGHAQLVYDFLASKNYKAFSDPRVLIRDALVHFKTKDFPYEKTAKHAFQYAYANGQLPLDIIINKVLPGLKDDPIIKCKDQNPDLPY